MTRQLPLPGKSFSDETVYAEECSKLFRDRWVSVTVGQIVSAPGDLFPCTIASLSLLVTRDREGQIHVFYNMCRHRGARLVDGACRARAGLMTCPYHAWSFQLDGSLFKAPYFFKDSENTQPDAETRAGLGLIEIRSRVWRDIIFIDITGNAPEFESFIRPIDEQLSDWDVNELRPLGAKEYEISANWKLAAENFLDIYHLPVVHHQLGGGMSGTLAAFDVQLSDDILGWI